MVSGIEARLYACDLGENSGIRAKNEHRAAANSGEKDDESSRVGGAHDELDGVVASEHLLATSANAIYHEHRVHMCVTRAHTRVGKVVRRCTSFHHTDRRAVAAHVKLARAAADEVVGTGVLPLQHNRAREFEARRVLLSVQAGDAGGARAADFECGMCIARMNSIVMVGNMNTKRVVVSSCVVSNGKSHPKRRSSAVGRHY
mmetsp:Transcript_48983/g.119989  ORF Transcript_48983/g.119989 Transcript_48983/m.119989 type:complete len:202 (-) Transcript_48983:2164-2769(-)